MNALIVDEWIQFAAALLAVSNVFGVIPLYIAMVAKLGPADRKLVATTACLTFGITLVLFVLLGEAILAFFGLGFPDFQIAGGTILAISGLQMVGAVAAPPGSMDGEGTTPAVIGLFPLGIPQLAGPGSMSTVLLFTHQEDGLSLIEHDLIAISVIVVMTIGFWVLFRLAAVYGALISPSVTAMITRVMGLILASIGVQFVTGGIIERFQIALV